MSAEGFELAIDRASEKDTLLLLQQCDDQFFPNLSSRVVLSEYAAKLNARATRFEAWAGQTLVGMVAVYFVEGNATQVFITNVSVAPDWQRKHVATKLLLACIELSKFKRMTEMTLEVDSSNSRAIAFYERMGFQMESRKGREVLMKILLSS